LIKKRQKRKAEGTKAPVFAFGYAAARPVFAFGYAVARPVFAFGYAAARKAEVKGLRLNGSRLTTLEPLNLEH